MQSKKHLFFDLDRTIWDFDKNAAETITELYGEFDLRNKGVDSFEMFFEIYQIINEQCWEQYRNGLLAKHELRAIRFKKSLAYFYIEDEILAERLGDMYLKRCPLKTNLISECHRVLSELNKKFDLHVITNGFEETQHTKLNNCGLSKYFDVVVTSEKAKSKKPFPAIFEFAMQNARANTQEAVMIGDDLTADIHGAHGVGMDSVWFNPIKNKLAPNEVPSSSTEIACLTELLPLFLK